MGVREAVEKNKASAIGGIIAVIALAGILIYRENRSVVSGLEVTKDYYSTDDGKTYFEDDANKIVPFDYAGQPAYLARVFKCSSGDEKPFVGYLVRYNDKAHQRMLALQNDQSDSGKAEFAQVQAAGQEVKRPGDSKWVSPIAPQAAAVTTIHCPAGGTIQSVIP